MEVQQSTRVEKLSLVQQRMPEELSSTKLPGEQHLTQRKLEELRLTQHMLEELRLAQRMPEELKMSSPVAETMLELRSLAPPH